MFGTYNIQEFDNFNSIVKTNSEPIKLLSVLGKIKLLDKVLAFYEEYIKGLKASNYFISKLFSIEVLKKTVDFKDNQLVIFEYWHAYKTAKQLKEEFPSVVTICDLHNILSSTYEIYITNHYFKKYFKQAYLKKYRAVEFNHALPVFDFLISINQEEHNQLCKKFGAQSILFCPMGIDLTAFNNASDYQVSEPIVILYYGGLGSQHNRDAATLVYNLFVKPAIQLDFNIQYKIIGSNAPEGFSSNFDAEIVNVVGYSKDLINDFKGVTMAVIPWEGKYGFRSRLIELAACNVPLFTTEDAVWGMGFVNNSTAFLIDKMNESAFDKFMALLKNSLLLKNVSKNAKTFVEDQYAFESTYEALAHKLNALCN